MDADFPLNRQHALDEHVADTTFDFDAAYFCGYSSYRAYFITAIVLFGVYTILTGVAIRIFLRETERAIFKRCIMLLCIPMYATAGVHLAIGVWFMVNHSRPGDRQIVVAHPAVFCVDEPSLKLANLLLELRLKLPCISICISDIIVIWRAWVLWPRKRTVQFVSSLLLVADVVSLAYSAIMPIQPSTSIPGSLLTWVTNIWTTSLVFWKAWEHHKEMKHNFFRYRSRTKAEKILLIFVESGVFYVILWTCVFVLTVYTKREIDDALLERVNPMYFAMLGSTFYGGFMNFVLIHLISIYPTATIVLVNYTELACNPVCLFESIHITQAPLQRSKDTQDAGHSGLDPLGTEALTLPDEPEWGNYSAHTHFPVPSYVTNGLRYISVPTDSECRDETGLTSAFITHSAG